jgi:cytoskeletal protein RodZ
VAPIPLCNQQIATSPQPDWVGQKKIERGSSGFGGWARLFFAARWLIGLLVFTVLLPAALRAQADDTVTLAVYAEKVASWQAALAEADDDAQVAAIQKEAAAIRQVTLPSGQVIAIQPLLGDPEVGTLAIWVARARLAAVQRELAAASSDETAARLLLLQNIWRRPEFTEQDSLWQRFWRWVRSWLPEFESREGGSTAISPLFQLVGWGLLGIGAVLIIFLLSYWLQTLLGRFMGGVERRGKRDDNALPQTADEARTAAHRLANAGSYRDAVRQLYLSALLSLHERNLITYQPSDTNREVLTAIRHQPQLHQQLQPVVATFDDVWYGVHEPDRTTFDRYVAAVEALEGKPS